MTSKLKDTISSSSYAGINTKEVRLCSNPFASATKTESYTMGMRIRMKRTRPCLNQATSFCTNRCKNISA